MDSKTNQNEKPALKRSHKSYLKQRRLRARMARNQQHPSSYAEQLRKTREHNQNFKKLTQKIKQMSRNASCPHVKPLSLVEKQLIINTVS